MSRSHLFGGIVVVVLLLVVAGLLAWHPWSHRPAAPGSSVAEKLEPPSGKPSAVEAAKPAETPAAKPAEGQAAAPAAATAGKPAEGPPAPTSPAPGQPATATAAKPAEGQSPAANSAPAGASTAPAAGTTGATSAPAAGATSAAPAPTTSTNGGAPAPAAGTTVAAPAPGATSAAPAPATSTNGGAPAPAAGTTSAAPAPAAASTSPAPPDTATAGAPVTAGQPAPAVPAANSSEGQAKQPGTAAATKPGATANAPQVAALPPSALKPGEVAPDFDVVRVERGHAVIAGRATAGAEISVHDGTRSLGDATATSQGEWVMTPETNLAPGTHELVLTEKLADGRVIASERQVVVMIPEPEKKIAAKPQPGIAGKPAETANAESEADAAKGSGGALVVAMPAQGSGPTQVLQTPTGPVKPGLGLDVIDYDQAGNLMLSGHAKPGLTVQAYLDNGILGHSLADVSGHWEIKPDKPVNPGNYHLRIDEIAANGKVVHRRVMAFERAKPAVTEAAAANEPRVVVQPGANLWRIARRTYGQGIHYTVIYKANREQIHDPRWIFPGQVFLVPPIQ